MSSQKDTFEIIETSPGTLKVDVHVERVERLSSSCNTEVVSSELTSPNKQLLGGSQNDDPSTNGI